MPFAARPARTFARLLPPILLVFASAAAMSAEAAKTPKPEAATASPSPSPTPTPPVSSEPGATTATFGDWVLRCQGAAAARICEVALTVQVQGQQAPIAQFAIGRAPDKSLRATVVLPTNIQLPSIVRVAGDAKDKTLELNWTRCLRRGAPARRRHAILAGRRRAAQADIRERGRPRGNAADFAARPAPGDRRAAEGVRPRSPGAIIRHATTKIDAEMPS